MNNQITILDRNSQSMNVNLICYFSNNNKKYIFYDKNETVQDGLIKMYVSEENLGLNNDITQDEWTNLKKIMQGIITGNTNSIEFLSYNNPIKVNEPKVIALNDVNINAIKNAYKNVVGVSSLNEPVLNKDILSQNFGNNTEVSVTTPETVQISPIPEIQNNFNMESTPVNLNINPIVENSDNQNVSESIPSVEPIIPNIEPIVNVSQPINDSFTDNNIGALNINNIKPGGIDSGFKVSNEPNIFDNPTIPYQITEEEINNLDMPQVNNGFDAVPTVDDTSKRVDDKDLTNKKIELNNRKIKLFEELANIYKEENELLKNEGSDSDVLERTASNLFNNNGTLNDNEVLG